MRALSFPYCGGVVGRAEEANRLSGFVTQGSATGLHPPRLSVRTDDSILGLVATATVDRALQRLRHPREVLGVASVEGLDALIEAPLGVAEQVDQTVVPGQLA